MLNVVCCSLALRLFFDTHIPCSIFPPQVNLNSTKQGKLTEIISQTAHIPLWWRKIEWRVKHEKKRINSNNIHLRVSFPQNGHHPPRSASLPSSSCYRKKPWPFSAVWGHGRSGSCLLAPPHLLGGLEPHKPASGNVIKLQIALK